MAVLEVKDDRGNIYNPQNPIPSQPSSRFTFKLNNGDMWVLYLDTRESLNLRLNSFDASRDYTGVIKLGLYENDAMLGQIEKYRNAYAMGGDVDYSFHGNSAQLTYHWKKSGSGDLLMLAMPHHVQHLDKPNTVKEVQYRTIRGNVEGIKGDHWTFNIDLPSYTWDSPTAVDDSKIARIKEALKADSNLQVTQGDPYFFGVAIGRLAKLALIADQLKEESLAHKIRGNMEKALTPWLLGNNPDALLYDKTYGGIISTNGVKDPSSDFGNGYYNDHHFHYGYHVFAAAVIGRKNPDFLNKHKEQILTYARDYANPSTDDKYFTTTRNKDWFGWHSWAAGLFEFADGRNQESTSEAIMSYYGLMLLGEAMHNEQMKNFGRLLLAMEIISAKTYWHMPSKSKIYPDVFKQNKMVGVLWSNKVDYATFFGDDPMFIHGIQMLPFLPPTEFSLDKDFMKEEFEKIRNANKYADWNPYKVCARAIIERDKAWEDALRLNEFHTGTCMTIVLHWIATRPH